MTVWIVFELDCGGHETVVKVFASEEKAVAFCSDRWDVEWEEWEVE